MPDSKLAPRERHVAAGVTHIYPHLLRHRRATLLHLNLVPAVEAAERLGHSTATQLLYVHATLQDRSEIDYEKLIKTLP